MSAQVLPKELRLQAPATMPQARSYLFKQQSTQSQYSEGQTIQINIPRLQRSYLTKDSYLKFVVQLKYDVNSGDTSTDRRLTDLICWDTCGALGMIDKIEVYDYLGSTLLESTAGHGQLMATLLDVSVKDSELGTFYNTIGDVDEGGKIWEGALTAIPAGTEPNTSTDLDVSQLRLRSTAPAFGGMLSNSALGNQTDTQRTVYAEYALPLFSFLGLLSPKFAPLHNGYTINITLNSWAVALGHTIAASNAADVWTWYTYTSSDPSEAEVTPTGRILTSESYVKDVYFASQVLELGPVAESMLLSSTGGQPLVIPSKAYRLYNGLIPAQSTSYHLDLNLNVASLTNLLFILRKTDYVSGTKNYMYKSLSGRQRNYLLDWHFQYGSSILPQTTGISCRGRSGYADDLRARAATEAYSELMKSRHNYSTNTHDTTITKESYLLDTYPSTNAILSLANVTVRGTFAAGLDLELVSGRSNDLICGMNTNGMNTAINLNFDTVNYTSVESCRLDCWCEYDAFINVSPGIATTVSF